MRRTRMHAGEARELSMKLCLVGDVAVGKTSLVHRISRGSFDERNYKTTVDGNFGGHQTVNYLGTTCRIHIWDTAGEEKFRAMMPCFLRSAKAIFVVYSITNRKSFENVNYWIEFITEHEPRVEFITICGNKSDIENGRVVSTKEGETVAERYKVSFFETSAKMGTNVCRLLQDLARRVHHQSSFSDSRSHQRQNSTIQLEMNPPGLNRRSAVAQADTDGEERQPKESKKGGCC